MEKLMPGKQLYVRCKVSSGLFETEYYVSVHRSSLYVDRAQVKVDRSPNPGDEVDGMVLAYVIHHDERIGEALVEFPGQPVVGGLRSWVPTGQLAFA